ncbi:MAG: hypothetical protein CSA64_03290 [Arachnia propionica]|nr:MAG: hypothetical protein CSA64_03290 [Arachnia propionica]
MGLPARLRLARLAAVVSSNQVTPALLDAGIDLLVLADSGDPAQDAEEFQRLRRSRRRSPLLACANPEAAKLAKADIVQLAAQPRWRLGGYPRGHQHGLVGCEVRASWQLRWPGAAVDYLFVGPNPTPVAIKLALSHQPVFATGSLPWFAYGEFDEAAAAALITQGVGRIALSATALAASSDPPRLLRELNKLLADAWRSEAARSYRLAVLG